MADDLATVAALPQSRLAVLPNPVDLDAIRSATPKNPIQWPDSGPHLLAAGRLAPVKGFDLLLRALALVRKRFAGADLVIAGAGPENPALKELAIQLGLHDAVHFPGHVQVLSDYLATAALFVLSSRHEGLPNALLEAAAAGLPMVATPASQGVVDLLRGQPGAWLSAGITVEALANSIGEALNGLLPGRRFPHLFVEQFDLSASIHSYEQLIDVAIKERRS